MSTPPGYFNVAVRALNSRWWWRATALSLALSTLVTSVTILALSSKLKPLVLPYVITLREGEQVASVGIVPTVFDIEKYPAVVYSALSFWLICKRQLIIDPAAYEQFWDMAEAYETQTLTVRLRPFKESQRARLKQGYATTIQIIDAAPIAGTRGRTWEVNWREMTTNVMGQPVFEDSGIFHATVAVSQLPPVPLKTPADYINAQRVFFEDFQEQKRSL